MALTRNQIILIGAVLLAIAVGVAIFIFGTQKPSEELSGQLNFWGVFDSPAAMERVINAYRAIHPKVEITYRQLDPDDYESNLLNALAGANPPDVFMFQNTWLPKHSDKIAPFSEQQISLANFRNLFPTVVEQNFAPNGTIYALPLYIDTLAFYYNQDLFDKKGIAVPPKNWAEFEKVIPKLRQIDKTGRIQKPAAAIGGSNKSINRATDILNLLMLQTGTKMVADDFSAATFSSPEGLNALEFYTKFANPVDPLYTWNDSLPYSLDSFAAGETAMMFNYSHQVAFLKDKNPFLRFRVMPMLQPQNNNNQLVNYANYWGLAAAPFSQNRAAAQDFILFMTTNPQASLQYLQSANRPPALRSLISQYANDPDFGVFANQALTARSWPQIDSAAIEKIFSDTIDSVISGKATAEKSLQEAASAVTELMQKRIR